MKKNKITSILFSLALAVPRFIGTNVFYLMLLLRKLIVIPLRIVGIAMFGVWVFALWLYPGQMPRPWLVILISFVSFVISWIYDFLLLFFKPKHIKGVLLN